MGDVMLQKASSVKYLGVILDEKVSWSNHMEYLTTKLSRNAGIFSKLRYYLNKETLIKVYHALFNSHLQYATLCWGTTNCTNLDRLQVLQNRAIRNMFKAPRYFRLDNYYLNYRILKVRDLYNLEVAKFMHGHHKKVLPTCFDDFFHERSNTHSYNTRSASRKNYSLVACRSSQGQRSIRFYGPKIWNSIPTSSRDLSKHRFKKYYKDFVLSKY